MAEGWKCPVCGKGVRPDKDTCEHGGGITYVPAPYYVPVPSYPRPWWDQPQWEVTCGTPTWGNGVAVAYGHVSGSADTRFLPMN